MRTETSTPALQDKATARGPMLTYRELSDYLGIGLRTCKRWVSEGTLPSPDLRIGRVVRWHRDPVERWLVRQGRATR